MFKPKPMTNDVAYHELVHADTHHQPRTRTWVAIAVLAAAIHMSLGLSARADDHPASTPDAAGSGDVTQLRHDLKEAMDAIRLLQRRLDAEHATGKHDSSDLQEQLDEQRARIDEIEQRFDVLSRPGLRAVSASLPSDAATTEVRGPNAGYDNGFFIRSADGNYALTANGLLQLRYTGFKPHDGNAAFVPGTGFVNNFDVFLGRLALSGNAFDPSINYFFQYQGISATNSNSVGMLDWWLSKKFSNAFSLKAGRTWTAYTYEYNDSPATYMFPDLSTAEYAFSLPRAIGAEASGQMGRFSYAAMVANSISALDVGAQDNFNNRLAYIGHIGFDILAPYGGVETDPKRTATDKTALSFWGSLAYNPVTVPSGFENVAAGDTTINGTVTVGFRAHLFSLQNTGYWRRTRAPGVPSDDSWGYGVQGGYYVVPKKLELVSQVDGVNWGAFHFGPVGTGNTWFAGPTFPYKTVQEDSLGFNYYFHGHNAKIQAAYSYLHGHDFTFTNFGANRIWLQSQLMF